MQRAQRKNIKYVSNVLLDSFRGLGFVAERPAGLFVLAISFGLAEAAFCGARLRGAYEKRHLNPVKSWFKMAMLSVRLVASLSFSAFTAVLAIMCSALIVPLLPVALLIASSAMALYALKGIYKYTFDAKTPGFFAHCAYLPTYLNNLVKTLRGKAVTIRNAHLDKSWDHLLGFASELAGVAMLVTMILLPPVALAMTSTAAMAVGLGIFFVTLAQKVKLAWSHREAQKHAPEISNIDVAEVSDAPEMTLADTPKPQVEAKSTLVTSLYDTLKSAGYADRAAATDLIGLESVQNGLQIRV